MSNPIQFRYRHLSGLHLVGFLAVMLFVLITARFPTILLWAGLIVLVPLYVLLMWRRILQRRERTDLAVVGTLSRNERNAARSKLKQIK
jgi:uncharacterized membrane protein